MKQQTLTFYTYLVVLALWIFSGSIVLYAIWTHLNYLQIDHAGHIASAAHLLTNGFHHFNDRFFLGYVSNLFYPPLEDIVLSGISLFTAGNMITAYQTYLSLLLTAYILSFYSFSRALKSYFSKTFYLGCMLLLFWINKRDLLEYQGLTMIDLMVTGLCSQFLGGIFFVLMMKELVQKNRARWITGLLFFTIISHIVMGLVAILVIVIKTATLKKEERESSILSLATAFGLASFFLVPFVVYRGYIVSSSIILESKPYLFFTFSLLGTALVLKGRKLLPFFLTALFILAPLVFGLALEAAGYPLPIFHYYRLGIIALFLLTMGFAVVLDSDPSWYKKIIPLSFAILILWTFNFKIIDFNSSEFRAPVVNWSGYKSSDEPFGRDWIIENDRSFGFGIDSILSLHDPKFHSNKGLFWESSKSNTLLTSYFATLFAPPVVLDYFYYYGYPCEIQRCLMDTFFQDYNIKRLIISANPPLYSAKPERRECFNDILKNQKTKDFTLQPNGSFHINYEQFNVYDLKSDRSTNRVVNYIAPRQFKSYEIPNAYEATLRDRYDSCVENRAETSLFFKPQDLEKIKAVSNVSLLENKNLPEIDFKNTAPGTYEITSHTSEKHWLWVKLAELPGVKITNEQGETVPHFQAFPGIIVYGQGKLIITYSTPLAAYFGYLISLGSLLICIL